MGCGASKDSKVGVSDSIKPVKSNNSSSNHMNNRNVKQDYKSNQYSDPRNLPDTQNSMFFVYKFEKFYFKCFNKLKIY